MGYKRIKHRADVYICTNLRVDFILFCGQVVNYISPWAAL